MMYPSILYEDNMESSPLHALQLDALSQLLLKQPQCHCTTQNFLLLNETKSLHAHTLFTGGHTAPRAPKKQAKYRYNARANLTATVTKRQRFLFVTSLFWGMCECVCVYVLLVPDFRVMSGGDYNYSVRTDTSCHLPQQPIRDSCPPPGLPFYKLNVG